MVPRSSTEIFNKQVDARAADRGSVRAANGFIDLTGQSFGKLVVIERGDSTTYGATRWSVHCECGNVKMVLAANLKRGATRSCGCGTGKRTHQQSGGRRSSPSGAYKSWHGMLQRCLNPKSAQYPRYGARGIKVCDRWRSFKNFYEDMGDRPARMSLDRRESNGNYAPDNCRWATSLEQARNTRSNVVNFDRVQEILGRFEHGESRASIGRRLEVNPSYVGKIVSGDVWCEIDRPHLKPTLEQEHG